MLEGFFRPVDLVDSLIIPWILLAEHKAREMCEVKGRLASWPVSPNCDSIWSLSILKCWRTTHAVGELQTIFRGWRRKKWTLLFLWNLLNTHTQSHLSKIKCFSCLVHFDLGLLWRFGSSWDFYLNMVPSNEVCQNEPGMSPSKNPTGMLCSSDIKVKINVSYPNQDAQS